MAPIDTLQRFGITTLNPMQEATIACTSRDKDMLLLAPTGSGKTLAFLLPLQEDNKTVLILAPSRELVLQIADVWHQLTGEQAATLYGGHEMKKERTMLSTTKKLIAGTPGRVADCIRREHLNPHDISLLIVDEFDKMLELGFNKVMTEIVEALSPTTAHWLISATDTDEANTLLRTEALRLDYRNTTLNVGTHHSPATQTAYQIISTNPDKLHTLYKLLHQVEQPCIIFLNHREAVERTSAYLAEQHVKHTPYHGGMEQQQRERALFEFRAGCSLILLSTDLASRGLDIPECRSIIHYHLPTSAEIYQHRNGRTSRGLNTEGEIYLIISEREAVPDWITTKTFQNNNKDNSTIPQPHYTTIYIGRGKKDKISKGDVVGCLCKQGGLKGEEINRIMIRDTHAYAAIPRAKLKATLTLLNPALIKGRATKAEPTDEA